jgi:hypothetical protein
VTATDLFIVGCLVLYLAALSLFTYYAQQNSQPARRVAADLVDAPQVAAGWRELADAVCAPRPEEVWDVEAH